MELTRAKQLRLSF